MGRLPDDEGSFPGLVLPRRGPPVTVGRRRVLAAVPAVLLPPLPARAAPEPRPWPAARPTPALALPAWEGPPVALAALRGRVVLINFWASWCEPCRAEMPALELLAARHEAEGLRVLAANFRETDGALRRFLDQTAFSLPVLRDRDGAAAQAFGVRIFPSTVAIGRDGRAAFTVIGEVDWTGAEARRWIAPLLAAPAPR